MMELASFCSGGLAAWRRHISRAAPCRSGDRMSITRIDRSPSSVRAELLLRIAGRRLSNATDASPFPALAVDDFDLQQGQIALAFLRRPHLARDRVRYGDEPLICSRDVDVSGRTGSSSRAAEEPVAFRRISSTPSPGEPCRIEE